MAFRKTNRAERVDVVTPEQRNVIQEHLAAAGGESVEDLTGVQREALRDALAGASNSE